MDLIKPSPLMTKMVHEDKTLGRKTGKGFFDVSEWALFEAYHINSTPTRRSNSYHCLIRLLVDRGDSKTVVQQHAIVVTLAEGRNVLKARCSGSTGSSRAPTFRLYSKLYRKYGLFHCVETLKMVWKDGCMDYQALS